MRQFIGQCTAPGGPSSRDDTVVHGSPAHLQNNPEIFTGYQSEDEYSANGSDTELEPQSESDESETAPAPSSLPASTLNELSLPAHAAPPLKRRRLDVPA